MNSSDLRAATPEPRWLQLELLTALADHLHSGFGVVDCSFRIVGINSALQPLLGCTRRDLSDSTLAQLPPLTWSNLELQLQRFFRGETITKQSSAGEGRHYAVRIDQRATADGTCLAFGHRRTFPSTSHTK